MPDAAAVFVWWVHGGDGWLSLLERMSAEGLELPEAQMDSMERLLARFQAVVEKQRKLKADPEREG